LGPVRAFFVWPIHTLNEAGQQELFWEKSYE
jgi:hypothetical protein